MPDEIWLVLSKNVKVAVPRERATSMSEKDFYRFYRQTVHGASRREAREWAKAQVAVREAVLRATR